MTIEKLHRTGTSPEKCFLNARRAPRTPGWRAAFVGLLFASTASSASAQNYSFDARRIALGGAGGTPNVASKIVERQRRYTSVLIPVGLIKVLSDIRVFFPTSDEFDLVRAVEYGTSPLHQVFRGEDDITGGRLLRDIVNRTVERDLNAYRTSDGGSGVESSVLAEGLVLLNWGYTFMLHEDERSFQGIYAGAGPYLAASAFAEFDGELVNILNASADRYVPAASLGVGGGETNELALALTGGYRARFPVFATDGEGARRNGMYVAANYHYLYGLRFDHFDARLQLDTDTNGLLTPDPPTTPFTLDWNTSRSGRGLALDFGVAFVRNRWDFGAGVGGVANRITWTKVRQNELSLVSLFNESEWIYNKQLIGRGTARIELPVTYTGDVSYHREKWSLYTEYSRGFQGNNFLAGLEYRLRTLRGVELRGGSRLSQGSWYPSFGAGFNLTRHFGVDAAVFGTKTFLETHRHIGLALSFRIDKGRTTSQADPSPTPVPTSGGGR
jgi:hypothetical protein